MSQDLDQQVMSINDYAYKNGVVVDEYIKVQMSARKTQHERKISELFDSLSNGDQLIVSELSRLGRSLGEIVRIIDRLIKMEVKFIAIKENLIVQGKQDIQNKVMVAMFGLFAEIERDLISERTKQGLIAARAKGKILGRPKGSKGISKLDGKEEEIKILLQKKVSVASIAKIVCASRTTVNHFIETRNIS